MSATDDIRTILTEIAVNRTRSNTKLSAPEIERFVSALSPVVTSLENKAVKDKPQWHGLSTGKPDITGDTKASVLRQWFTRIGITDPDTKVPSQAFLDKDTGKRVYYWYAVPTETGTEILYAAHEDYLGRIPIYAPDDTDDTDDEDEGTE